LSLVLIGAGFNADAACEVGPVYGNSIYAGRYRIECGYPLVADTARLCFGLKEAPSDKSIETLFSEHLTHGDYEPVKALADRLMEADYRLASHLATAGSPNCYRDFFQAFAGANFLTFNYDSLPEIMLNHRQCWYPEDGYGVPVEVERESLPGATPVADVKSDSLILHLHGSFCLRTTDFEIQEERSGGLASLVLLSRPRYKFDPDSISLCFPKYRRVPPDPSYEGIEYRVIAPVPNKTEDLKQAFVREIYTKALPLVKASGCLVAVGYSFNENDRTSYGPILQALAESDERRLFVVAPDAVKVAERVAEQYPRIHTGAIGKTFKDWAVDSFRL
jgi:hypothetical protein